MTPVSREFTIKLLVCGTIPKNPYLNHTQTREFLHLVSQEAMAYIGDQIYGPITYTAAWVDLQDLHIRNINTSP